MNKRELVELRGRLIACMASLYEMEEVFGPSVLKKGGSIEGRIMKLVGGLLEIEDPHSLRELSDIAKIALVVLAIENAIAERRKIRIFISEI